MRYVLLALGLSVGLAFAPMPPIPMPAAFAQTAGAVTPQIGRQQARRIAAASGVVRVKEIELDDGKWEIEGTDGAGRKIEIDIDARSGKVLRIERD